jgi:S1-C subfamily serine protease
MDAAYDLALLIPTIDDFVKVPLDITSESAFIVGAQVSTWGFPEGYQNLMPLLTVGYLAGSDEDKSNPGIVVKKWIVNGAFNRGNSGGPVLETKTGKVFAVISGKLAPMPKNLENSLHKIEKEGSLEGQTIAKILNHVGKQTQLVIGYATLTEDLRRFLKDNGVEP